MESEKAEPAPKKTRSRAVLIIALIVIAVLAAAFYYTQTPHESAQFSLTVNPPFFHAAAGGGFLLFVKISRVAGFTGEVNVALLNPPSWITSPTLVLNKNNNGSLAFPLSKDAPLGSYQLTVQGTGQGSSPASVMVSLRVVGVKPLKSARGSAMVYDTTKILDSATLAGLASVVNGTFQFSKTTPQLDALEKGDVIAASFGRTPLMPHGFLRTVLDIRKANGQVFVDTRAASVLEAAEEIQFGAQKRNATATATPGMATASVGLQPDNAIDACSSLGLCQSLYSNSWEPLGSGGVNLGGDANFYLGVTLQLSLGGGGHISWDGIDWLVVGLFGHEEAKASIKGTALSQFTWSNDNIQTLYKDDIPIIPPIINFHIEVDLAGRSSGTLLENINTGIDQTFDMVLAITDNANSAPSAVQAFCNGGGWNPCASAQPHYTPTININPPRNPGSSCSSGSGGNCPRVEIGPKLSIGIDGNAFDVASVSGGGDGEVDVFWELDNQAGTPVWSLYLGLTGHVGVYASAGFNACLVGCYTTIFSFSPSWPLPDFVRLDIQDAGNLPPPTPTLIIPNSADTIDLSNPSFLNPNMFGSWTTLSGVEPEGETVTCIWQTAELGQLGTSTAVAAGGNALACHGPAGAFPGDQVEKIISRSLTKITVTVIAQDSAGKKSSPSNAVTVKVNLPTPILNIQQYFPNPIYQNQAFTIIGTARMSTVTSSTYPNGVIDFCLTSPQRLGWAVGGYYSPDLGGWVDAYNNPNTFGRTCTAQMSIPVAGSNTINFYLVTPDGSDLVKDNKGNPIVASEKVNVLPSQATQTTPAGPPLAVKITTASNAYPNTINVNTKPIQISGTVTGGTAPYTITWFVIYTWNGPQMATIVTGGSNDLTYDWNVCNTLGNKAGTANIFLKASDSKGASGQAPTSITINYNCEVAQAIRPLPGMGIMLVSFLSVFLALTADRVAPILQNRLRLCPKPPVPLAVTDRFQEVLPVLRSL